MASFIADLAQSIFTPGPTSSLVLATNVSFACLQVVLLVLLITTYSIHFVILSVISAGLWAGINWFVNELRIVKAQEEEEERAKKAQAAGDAAGDDTETEGETVVAATGKESRANKPASSSLEPGNLRGRTKERDSGNRSEISTEDEWERVDESEKDK